MSDSQYYLSPNQQDLLVAALASNQPSGLNSASRKSTDLKLSKEAEDNEVTRKQNGDKHSTNDHFDTSPQTTAMPGQFGTADDSPYLGFDLDADVDDQFDFDTNGQLIGDLSGNLSQPDLSELHDKRKSVGDREDDDEGGGKRRESEGGTGKKPGRKPLTAEPTTKRKAQNRAAQRAFRDRKEKHLRDLETKVEDLEKASETKNNENGLLRAQVERLQIELKEYRKRLSWISSSSQGGSSSLGSSAPGAAARTAPISNSNDFQFEFPRFGNLPANHLNGSTSNNGTVNNPVRSATLPTKPSSFGVPGVVGRNSLSSSSPKRSPPNYGSAGNSPLNATGASPPARSNQTFASDNSFDSFSGLFSPSILEASRQASIGYFPQNNANPSHQASQKAGQISPGTNVRQYSASSMSNTDSPASSYESQQNGSSIGTSPEPSLSSPGQKMTDSCLGTISEENQPQNIAGERSFCEQLAMACGDSKNPVPRMMSTSNGSVYPSGSGITPGLDPNSFNWFAQQNGGGFDPVLFGDFRESQDALASQDFGAFFNDAFPLPELGSPEHNFNEVAPSPAKPDLMAQVEAVQEGKEEVIAADDKLKMLTCTKIWDRLQSMEQFRNGEIDIDNLCSDLRSKARCSEGGAVVHQKDLDNVLGSVR